MSSILNQKKDYTRYYGDFRGVDFSSDHTQVHEQRLAYAVNMYRDYQSGQGQALETIPGFRRMVELPGEPQVYGLHDIRIKGEDAPRVLIHAGKKLYIWSDYPSGSSVTELNNEIEMNERKSTSFICNNRLYIIDGKNYLVYDGENVSSVLDTKCYIPTTYIGIIPSGENADKGKEHEQRNMLSPYFKHTFVADGTTTDFYMNEDNLDEVTEVKVYGEVVSKSEYTVEDPTAGKITFTTAPVKPETKGHPEFYPGIEITAKKTWKSVSGVTDGMENIHELITECTIATVFDNRVFLSGNPAYPNHIFYCGRNSTGYVDPTYFGVLNYMQDGFGNSPITGMIPVADTLMVLKNDTQQDGSTYYHSAYDTGKDIQPRIYPSQQGLAGIGCLGACVNFLDDPIFISRLGVEGIGQLSVRYERAVEHRSSLIDAKLVNMNLENAVLTEWNGYLVLLVDGNIFLADSRQKYTHAIGVPQYEWYYLEGIGVYKDQYKEYRYSSRENDEALGATIRHCTVCGNNADVCTCGNQNGIVELVLKLSPDMNGEVVNPPDELSGMSTKTVHCDMLTIPYYDAETDKTLTFEKGVFYTVSEIFSMTTGESIGYEAYLCEAPGNKIGGEFKPATVVKTIGSNLFFGTENGVICSFNFDKRNSEGEISPADYAFDDRTIVCGCATKMDCCGIPHLTKSTVKKSTVIKTKSMQISAAKVKVRTNRKPYEQIARINSAVFSFEDIDFADYSFVTTDQSLFSVKEKEKKWVEKQYYIYSDEYLRPFALYYVTYRYNVAGRYKE